MSTIRTFLAVEVSSKIRQRACEAMAKLQSSGVKIKWVERENLHLTLHFLGDVDERNVHEICGAVSQAASCVSPFEFDCRGIGAFPDTDRPRTIWLGVDRGHDEMCALQGTSEAVLDELGYPKENRKYHPHLTLGRIRQGGRGLRRLSEILDQLADFDAGSTVTTDVVVFSSHRQPSGPVYEVLCRVPLGSKA